MSEVNRQVRLVARPVGDVKASDFELTEEAVGEPGDGQITVKISHISLDPAMRGWMNDAPSYIPPVGLGDVMRAGTVGQVTASKSDAFAVGDHVYGALGVQEHAVTDVAGLTKVDPNLAPLPTYLGTLGMTGLTAYFGLQEVGQLKEGDTVLVSGAAGATGGAVGQIAKIKGARAIGIAGGAEKCAYVVDELGFDACVDYKSADFAADLRKATPDRCNIYFDNVGGDILDAALTRIGPGSRVVICGAISQYNATEAIKGPSNYLALLVFRASMKGFIVFDYVKQYGAAMQEMAGWRAEGKLTGREHVIDGSVADFHDTLQMLFRGENVGKLVLGI